MMTYRYIILHAFISFLVEMSLTVYATQFLKIYNFTQMHLDCLSDIFPSSTLCMSWGCLFQRCCSFRICFVFTYNFTLSLVCNLSYMVSDKKTVVHWMRTSGFSNKYSFSYVQVRSKILNEKRKKQAKWQKNWKTFA